MGEAEEGKGGQMVMERDLTWGGEHTIYRWCIIELYPESYILLLTNVTSTNSIKCLSVKSFKKVEGKKVVESSYDSKEEAAS